MNRKFAAALCLLLASATAGESRTLGWRMDGSGNYPDATPPTVWAKDKNIVWSTPMPGASNACPVLAGDKLFVTSEPNTLICMNAADGKILWQKSNDLSDVLAPEDRDKAAAALKEAQPIKTELQQADVEFRRLRGEQRKAPNDEAIKKKIDEQKKKIDELNAKLKPLTINEAPKTHPTNGYASATPLVDGDNIYIAFGNGIVANYSADGTRRWIRKLEKPAHEWGFSASPMLCGGKLLIHYTTLQALDPADGKTLWTANLEYSWGTPVALKMGDVDAAITAKGDVVRAADGVVIAKRQSKLDYATPVLKDGIVYFIENGGKALKVPETAGENLTFATLWQTRPKADRYYASPVITADLIYAINQTNTFSAIDAKNGQVVYEKALNLSGKAYPSITMAGKYLFVSNDEGTTVVVEPGREYKELGRNTFEGFRGSPVFAGNRLYIRGYKNMYCIGERQ